MDIDIEPRWLAYIRDRVDEGTFASPADVVHEGLRLLHERERRLLELRAEVDKGLASLDRGDFLELDDEGLRGYLEDVDRRGRERLAKKNAQAS